MHVHPRGWMDEDGMKLWIRKVWCNRPGGLMKRKSLLVFDSFRAHLVLGVEGTLREENTDICVIPGGLTSQLQPLDVCLNKPLKQGMRMKWTEWLMDKTNHDFTPSGLLKKPSISFMCAWIKEVWKGLHPDMIVKSFKKCSISNAIDGAEDDYIYQDDIGESEDPFSDLDESGDAFADAYDA